MKTKRYIIHLSSVEVSTFEFLCSGIFIMKFLLFCILLFALYYALWKCFCQLYIYRLGTKHWIKHSPCGLGHCFRADKTKLASVDPHSSACHPHLLWRPFNTPLALGVMGKAGWLAPGVMMGKAGCQAITSSEACSSSLPLPITPPFKMSSAFQNI